MKKIFSFCAAMLMALVANATIWQITPTSPREKDNIRYCLRDNAAAGDTILLTENGPYGESDAITIDKNIVIMAAEGKHPTVNLTYYTKIKTAAVAKIIGLTFNGGGTCEYAFRAYDNSATAVTFENCEFTGFTKYVITSSESYHIDSCIVNNCYFHDNGRAAVYFPPCTLEDATVNTVDYVRVTNSTITNITALNTAIIDVRNHNQDYTENIRLEVDHCTFYNWVGGTNGAVMSYKSPLSSVTNCIFAEPEATTYYAAYCYGGDVKNCLSFNVTGHRDWDAHPNMVANITGDPLFNDAANGDYSLKEGSPALGAGTDGSNLGDPRWWPAAPVAGCDWDNIAFLGDGSTEQTFGNQFKVCKAGEQPNVVNIQTAPWANNNTGIYINFPDAVIGNISLPADQYKIEGAGILLFLSAFTAVETEVTVEWQDGVYTFTVYNAKGGSASNVITDITLNVTVPVVGEVLKNMVFPTDPVWATYASLVTLPDGVNYELMRFQVYLGDGNYAEDGVFEPNTAYRFDVAVQPKEGYEFPMNDNTSIKLDELNLTVNQNGEGYNMYNGWGYFGIIVNFTTGTATAIENNAVVEKTVKFIENGQLFIEKNGVRYNAQGAVVR